MEWWVQCEKNPSEITRQQLTKEVKYTHKSVLQHLLFELSETIIWRFIWQWPWCLVPNNSFRIHSTHERKEENSVWSESLFFLQKSPWFTTWIKPWSCFFFPSELKVCGNNRYIPVSSACKTMETQSKRDQQPIKPKPQGLRANRDVSRVEELVEAACSGFLPQELSVSSCSIWQKGIIESQTWNLLAKHRDDLQYCRIIVTSATECTHHICAFVGMIWMT